MNDAIFASGELTLDNSFCQAVRTMDSYLLMVSGVSNLS
jgi:hypothetical protein